MNVTVDIQKRYSFEHMNAHFLGKKQRNIPSLTMHEKNILMSLFYKKYFVE